MRACLAAIPQRIADDELYPADVAGLRIRPGLAVAITGPQAYPRKLILQSLELKALLHALLIQQLQVFRIDDSRLSVHQKQAAGVAHWIGHPGNVDWSDCVEASHDPDFAARLLVKFTGEADRVGWSSRLGHLVDHAFAEL